VHARLSREITEASCGGQGGFLGVDAVAPMSLPVKEVRKRPRELPDMGVGSRDGDVAKGE
jgi:hypothetical protein